MNQDNQSSHLDHSHTSQGYRPRSPDLSDFPAPSPPRLSRLPSIPHQPEGFPPGYTLRPRGSYDASPYFSPSQAQAPSYFGSQPHQVPFQSTDGAGFYTQSPLIQTLQPLQPIDNMARLRNRPQVNYSEPAHREDEFEDERMMQRNDSRIPPPPQPVMPAQSIIQMHEPALQPQAFDPTQQIVPPQQQQSVLPAVNVRTKFPVARIKRIMQADEDIGKVAQATPTAVAKALECFMIALVMKGAGDAKAANSKRVTATHLKTALLNDPQYDFLNEICESAPDESARRSKAKSEAKSEDSDDEDIGGPAKKRKGGKRKKDESD